LRVGLCHRQGSSTGRCGLRRSEPEERLDDAARLDAGDGQAGCDLYAASNALAKQIELERLPTCSFPPISIG
jgi:hypothetical protein